VRVFVPVTSTGLRALVAAGGIGPPPVPGFAVTGALREWYAEGDQEELEYVAMTVAAQAALRLLAAAPDDPPRRIVLAVDTDEAVPDTAGVAAGERAAVLVGSPVRATQLAAVHADTDDAAADVAAAVQVVRAGGPRDDDEQFVLDTCEAHELAWFASQEITDLL
jgi:hypothetical protein